VLDACESDGIGFIPWFPLAAGEVDEVDSEAETASDQSSGDEPRDGVHDIADRHDATPHQIALAWLLQSSDVTLPIPGTSSIEHLEQNVAAADISLTDDEIATLA